MRTIKGKVTIDGVEHEVELPLPDGYVTPDEVQQLYVPKASVENSTAAAVRAETTKQRDKFLSGEDEEFKTAFTTKHNLVEAGKEPPDLDARLKGAEGEWQKVQLVPVQEENTTLKNQNSSLLKAKLTADVIAAAAKAGVKKSLLQPGPNGMTQIVNMVGNYFAYDSEHGYYAVVKEIDVEGRPSFQFSGKPEEGKPHATVGEWFTTWAEDKANADFLDDVRIRGAKVGDDVKHEGRTKTIPVGDLEAAGANLEGLASGEVTRE